MKRYRIQSGFTLVELLVVSAIIVVLASAMVGVGRRMLTLAQVKLARSTIEVVVTAIEQYRSELDRFPMEYLNAQPMPVLSMPIQDLSGKIKPAFGQTDLIEYLKEDLGPSHWNMPPSEVSIKPVGSLRPEYASSECLYYFLQKVPASRRIIETIAENQTTAIDPDYPTQPREALYWDGKITLIRIVDPWESPFRYEYCRPTKTFPGVPTMSFPRITSAGPDKKFDTPDDLRSDE